MALSSLTAKLSGVLNWTASVVRAGFSPISVTDNISDQFQFSKGVNNVQVVGGVAGADFLAAQIYSIASSGNTKIDLKSMTDILNESGVVLARVKGIILQLLSEAQDGANGTNCTFITVGNSGSDDLISVSGSGWFHGTNQSIDIPNGGRLRFEVANGNGIAVSNTSRYVLITNGDSGNAAGVRVAIIGATS